MHFCKVKLYNILIQNMYIFHKITHEPCLAVTPLPQAVYGSYVIGI